MAATGFWTTKHVSNYVSNGFLAGPLKCVDRSVLLMATRHFRRFRMELDFRRTVIPAAELPDGYAWRPWSPLLQERHACVKWQSFHNEIDAHVFTCLGQLSGCRHLMHEIARQRTFLPSATWLIVHQTQSEWPVADCGTIQGICAARRLGAIQNVGVVPEHRGQGLGRAMVLKSLAGFQERGMKRVYLEVTAVNEMAVELYKSIGFELVRTMYRTVEVVDPIAPQLERIAV